MKGKLFKKGIAVAAACAIAVGAVEAVPKIKGDWIFGAKVNATDGVAINSENFPDDIFKQYVADNFDKDSDGFLSDLEIDQVIKIILNRSGVQSLKGIEIFSELTELQCEECQLTSIDVRNNTALKKLYCQSNQLTTLDVSNNTALTHLGCFDTQLTSLDVSNNIALESLDCWRNKLTTLDVSKNTALEFLRCSENKGLTSLDISQNTALKNLDCGRCPLGSLDISKNTALKTLYCDNNKLTSLDVSNNVALTFIDCSGDNRFSTLELSNNTALTTLRCSNNKLTSLNISKNIALKSLDCRYNQLTTLDVSNNTALTDLKCNGNKFYIGEICGTYDLKKLPSIFDIHKASNWQGTELKDNILTEIDGTGNISYDYDCGINYIAGFNLYYSLTDHTYDEGVITTEPTLEYEGVKTYTCVNCGAIKTESVDKLCTHRAFSYFHANPATCESDGNTAYWYCVDCGNYFSDENFTIETTLEDTIILAKGHIMSTTPDLYLTLGITSHSYYYYYCENCGMWMKDAYLAEDHNFVDGVCTVCGAADPDYVEPTKPETPNVPENPDTPVTPDTPSIPANPDTPITPDTPSIPENPDTPTTPDTPSIPENPDTPETPNIPSTPSVPNIPSNPGNSGNTTTPEQGSGNVIHATASANEYSAAGVMTAINASRPGTIIRINAQSGSPITERAAKELAIRRNVTVSMEYSGYSVSVNSDNMNPDKIGSFDFSSKTKFLTKSEEKSFEGAAEVRQFAFKSSSFSGISTAKLTVTMTGGSKGKTAKLLLRTAEGKYILVAEAAVGSKDRQVSFDITKPGNYVVYTGDADIEYETVK